nr:PKD domain-containing protein [Streptomyces murinus]
MFTVPQPANAWEVAYRILTFGDGEQESLPDGPQKIEHQYPAAGTYTATLTQTDLLGRTTTARVTVHAADAFLPVAARYDAERTIPAHGVPKLSAATVHAGSDGIDAAHLQTVTSGAKANGTLTVHTDGTTRPGTSTLGLGPGRTASNEATVKVTPTGAIDLCNSGSGPVTVNVATPGLQPHAQFGRTYHPPHADPPARHPQRHRRPHRGRGRRSLAHPDRLRHPRRPDPSQRRGARRGGDHHQGARQPHGIPRRHHQLRYERPVPDHGTDHLRSDRRTHGLTGRRQGRTPQQQQVPGEPRSGRDRLVRPHRERADVPAGQPRTHPQHPYRDRREDRRARRPRHAQTHRCPWGTGERSERGRPQSHGAFADRQRPPHRVRRRHHPAGRTLGRPHQRTPHGRRRTGQGGRGRRGRPAQRRYHRRRHRHRSPRRPHPRHRGQTAHHGPSGPPADTPENPPRDIRHPTIPRRTYTIRLPGRA